MSANDVVGTLTRGLKEIHLDDSELDDRTVIGESELVRRYDEINAKTMYNMMEARSGLCATRLRCARSSG